MNKIANALSYLIVGATLGLSITVAGLHIYLGAMQ